MVAPVAIAAGKKAADNPGAVLLIGVIGLVMLSRAVKAIPTIPTIPDIGEMLGGAWDRFREFGEVDIPNLTNRALLYPSEVTNDAIAAAWGQSRSVVTGFWQGDLDEDDPGPEYYGKVHYDQSGVPIAVPAEVDRTAKGIGRAIRGAVGDWSIPGL